MEARCEDQARVADLAVGGGSDPTRVLASRLQYQVQAAATAARRSALAGVDNLERGDRRVEGYPLCAVARRRLSSAFLGSGRRIFEDLCMGTDHRIRHTPDVFCRCGAESFELRDLDLNLNGNTNSCNTCGKVFKNSRRLRILQDKRRAQAALLEECEQLPLSNHFLLAEELTNADIALEELEPIGVPPESLAGRILARGLQATVVARCSRR